MGIPPCGKKITWTESHWGRIVDGKLVEHWMDADTLGMLTQMGAIPEQQPAQQNAQG
jgi:predicted ester cyclase